MTARGGYLPIDHLPCRQSADWMRGAIAGIVAPENDAVGVVKHSMMDEFHSDVLVSSKLRETKGS